MEGSPSACRLPDRVTRAQITAATRREWTSSTHAGTLPPIRGHRAALPTALVPSMKIARLISKSVVVHRSIKIDRP
jgi:hypothetical protein